MECTSSISLKDREAFFEELYESAFPRVARLVKRRGGDLQEARDIFQEAVICFYEKSISGNLDIRTSPAVYVTGIARHLWLHRCRETQRKVPLERLPLSDITVNPVEEKAGPGRQLLTYLESAGRRCMDLLQAFYYHRLSMREIAEEFGYKGERSATVQKYKCLEKVRETVREKERVSV